MAFWLAPNEAVLVISCILMIIGAVNIFSASFVLAAELMNNSYYFLLQYGKSFAIGLVGFLAVVRLGYRRLAAVTPLIILTTIALLAAVLLFGEDANGAKRWLRVGLKFQPSELAKLTVILMNAVHLGGRLERRLPISLISLPMGVTLLFGGLVMLQPDMGTAAVIVGLGVAMHLIAGVSRKEIIGLAFTGTTVVTYFVFAAAYRADRIWAWLDPWSYQQGIGYQSVQALLAIGSGGLLGAGFGKGSSKFYYLPEAHTDFAFAVLCQEQGFIGALVVAGLLAGIGFYGIKIALDARDWQGTLLATGVIVLILGQAVGNIAMVCGLIPVTGVPLPFISYGGTSLLINLLALAFLISVGRYRKRPQASDEEEPEPPPRPRLSLISRTSSEFPQKRQY
ncbi:MAG: FtsW/RodA/SpoVE family cell cycle protein [Sporomusaceae bacterium]|nr:FtsW/RodA/SpoVE family cell cycle protein [Sporomusaceae bacterium]